MNPNMVNIKTSKAMVALFLLLTSLTSTCMALPSDREQLLKVCADSADLNQSTHQGFYEGHVEINQGTTHLRAAKAITEANTKNKLIKAIALGNKQKQAHIWTLMEDNKPILHAYADKIYYYPKRNLIELIGNARIVQGDNLFSAPKIIYNTLEQHVVTEKKGKTRTSIIIHPEKHS